VVGVGTLEGAGTHGDKFVGAIDVVDSQKRQSAVVGVSPPGADSAEGIAEFLIHDAVDGVICRCVEVAGNDRREAGISGFLPEAGEGVGKFNLPESAVADVLPPTLPLVEAHVGGGGLEVDVEKLKLSTIAHFDRDKLAAVARDFNLVVNGALDEDRTSFFGVIAVVAVSIEKLIDELLEAIGVWDFLEENDVRH